jgi:hypothetical protein
MKERSSTSGHARYIPVECCIPPAKPQLSRSIPAPSWQPRWLMHAVYQNRSLRRSIPGGDSSGRRDSNHLCTDSPHYDIIRPKREEMTRDTEAFSLIRTKPRPPRLPADLIHRRRLVDRLQAGLDRKLTLISAQAGDDYQTTTKPEIHQLRSVLLQHLPQSVLWALASRSDPPLPILQLRARRQSPTGRRHLMAPSCCTRASTGPSRLRSTATGRRRRSCGWVDAHPASTEKGVAHKTN